MLLMGLLLTTLATHPGGGGHQPWHSFPTYQCLSAYGETACGFSCTSGYGDLKCAQTPLGVCHSAYGEVVCWDPPRWLGYHLPPGMPRASCISAYGDIACGFRCQAAFGEVACAQTPWGTCTVSYGDLICADPPPPE